MAAVAFAIKLLGPGLELLRIVGFGGGRQLNRRLLHFSSPSHPLLALVVAVVVVCAWLVRKRAGRPIDPDRSALGLALTIVSAPGEGPYTGIFTLPALARVGGRRGLEALPWFASAAAWAALLVAGLLYDGPDWQSAWALFTLVSTWFLIHGYPLLRPDRLIAASSPSRMSSSPNVNSSP